MSFSAQTLRPSPYSLPPPAAGRRPVTYSSQTFSTQLHHHYNFNPPPSSSQSGFSFQNSMLLPCPQPPPQLGLLPPPVTSTSMSDSPVQESPDGLLPPQRQSSVSSHGSPIPPTSPIMEEEQPGEQYKVCNYRPTAIGSSSPNFGMNAHPPFNSFSSSHQPTTLPMPCGMGMGYPTPPSTMCPPSVYTSQDMMCQNGTSPLSLPMWNYPSLGGMGICPPGNLGGNPISKHSFDSPRYKLTPERAVPLIKWFEEKKEHPYPTRHEKVLLCQSTQLTYTQVSTWFANARRRMKKVNSEEEENRSNHSSSDDCASQNSLDSPLRPS